MGRAAAGGAGADPLLRRARPRVRRPAARRVRPRRARRRDLARGQAPLHRPARRAPPAGARRDVLQLGDHADPPAHLLRERPDLRPRGDLDRADRGRPADLPQLLPAVERAARLLRPPLPRLRLEPSPSPTSTATSTGCSTSVGEPLRRTSSRTTRSRCSARPSTATRPPTCSGRSSTATTSCRSSSPSCTTRTGGSSSTRSCSTRSGSTCSSRSRARTSWSTWRCRRATSTSCAR